MPIASTELVLYNAVNRPVDDTTLAGGARDAQVRPDFTQLAANDTVEQVSDNAGDTTQTTTLSGRDPTGALQSDSKGVNGTNVVAFTGTFERALSANMNANAAGTITIRRSGGGATIFQIPPGERGFSAMFIDSASEAAPTTRFDKGFWTNTNGSLTLNNAQVQLSADPAGKIRQGVGLALNDTTTITNRKTSPAGITFVDDGVQQPVPGNALPATDSISVWYEMALLADDAPIRNVFTTEIAGTSV